MFLSVCIKDPIEKETGIWANAVTHYLIVCGVSDIDKKLTAHKKEAAHTGLSIVSDGWSNVQNRPIINFLAVTSDGPIFLDAFNTSSEKMDNSLLQCYQSRLKSLGKKM